MGVCVCVCVCACVCLGDGEKAIYRMVHPPVLVSNERSMMLQAYQA